MTLKPEDETLQMVSIPGDTRTKIVGHGTVEKINHAYAYGGTKMSMDTVEHFLNITSDYYIRINMEGLADLVNAVGGTTVYNDDSWHDPGYYQKGYFYHEGELNMNGAQALGLEVSDS
jgi:LCP family protein required for cell wall assembly